MGLKIWQMRSVIHQNLVRHHSRPLLPHKVCTLCSFGLPILKLHHCLIHITVATQRGDLKKRHNGRTSINSQEGARPSLGVLCDLSKLEYFISEHKLILLPINQSTNTTWSLQPDWILQQTAWPQILMRIWRMITATIVLPLKKPPQRWWGCHINRQSSVEVEILVFEWLNLMYVYLKWVYYCPLLQDSIGSNNRQGVRVNGLGFCIVGRLIRKSFPGPSQILEALTAVWHTLYTLCSYLRLGVQWRGLLLR